MYIYLYICIYIYVCIYIYLLYIYINGETHLKETKVNSANSRHC